MAAPASGQELTPWCQRRGALTGPARRQPRTSTVHLMAEAIPPAKHLSRAEGCCGVRFEADQAAQVLATPGVEIVGLVAVHGASVPWASWSPTACPW
jgi:hypothetical protein